MRSENQPTPFPRRSSSPKASPRLPSPQAQAQRLPPVTLWAKLLGSGWEGGAGLRAGNGEPERPDQVARKPVGALGSSGKGLEVGGYTSALFQAWHTDTAQGLGVSGAKLLAFQPQRGHVSALRLWTWDIPPLSLSFPTHNTRMTYHPFCKVLMGNGSEKQADPLSQALCISWTADLHSAQPLYQPLGSRVVERLETCPFGWPEVAEDRGPT